jgi:DNA-binding PadR family transcriptional regulator
VLYGVLSRLGDEGLISAVRTEQEGRRPARWHTELGEQLATRAGRPRLVSDQASVR